MSLQHVAEVGARKLGPHGVGGWEGAIDEAAKRLHAWFVEGDPHPHLAAEFPVASKPNLQQSF